ncbi:group III truncated hemoglobin [Azospirillum sp. ST 5-10]|uniref:group III truncated hemoglobin n=1 Tax=unclassified Azospirillum TaxID=2630922 RepID=UPI003F49BEDD
MSTDRTDASARPSLRDITVAERVAATGIDEAMIERLVRAFYGKIRDDAVLGPIFAAEITDWEPHLRKMMDFWSSVALLTGRYDGRPMPVHARLDVGAAEFERWLALFAETTAEVCTPQAARFFMDRAHNIARSLLMGIQYVQGMARA